MKELLRDRIDILSDSVGKALEFQRPADQQAELMKAGQVFRAIPFDEIDPNEKRRLRRVISQIPPLSQEAKEEAAYFLAEKIRKYGQEFTQEDSREGLIKRGIFSRQETGEILKSGLVRWADVKPEWNQQEFENGFGSDQAWNKAVFETAARISEDQVIKGSLRVDKIMTERKTLDRGLVSAAVPQLTQASAIPAQEPMVAVISEPIGNSINGSAVIPEARGDEGLMVVETPEATEDEEVEPVSPSAENSELDELRKENQQLVEENNRLTQELAAKDQALTEERQDSQEKDAKLAEAQEQAQRQESDVVELEARIATSQQELEEASQLLANQERDIAALRQEVAALEQRVNDAENDLSFSRAENGRLAEELSKYENRSLFGRLRVVKHFGQTSLSKIAEAAKGTAKRFSKGADSIVQWSKQHPVAPTLSALAVPVAIKASTEGWQILMPRSFSFEGALGAIAFMTVMGLISFPGPRNKAKETWNKVFTRAEN